MKGRSFTFSVTNNHAQPGVEFFVVLLELIGSDDCFAGSVLDDANNSFNSSNSFMILGKSGSEFDGR